MLPYFETNETIENSEIRPRNYMWNLVKSGWVVFELSCKMQNMQMCVQGCHFLRFLKKNTWRHVGDQYVVRMQKGIKIGPVVWPLTRSFISSFLHIFDHGYPCIYSKIFWYFNCTLYFIYGRCEGFILLSCVDLFFFFGKYLV